MTAEEERASIVAFLRSISEGLTTVMQAKAWSGPKLVELENGIQAYAYVADAIEQGAHLKGRGDE